MRYFKTGNANRPYRAGGFVFDFPPTVFHCGGWIGILAVSDDKQAEALAKHGAPVKEITQEEYSLLKKKVMSPGSSTTQAQLDAQKHTKAKDAEPVAADVRDEVGYTRASLDDPLDKDDGKKSTPRKAKKTS